MRSPGGRVAHARGVVSLPGNYREPAGRERRACPAAHSRASGEVFVCCTRRSLAQCGLVPPHPDGRVAEANPWLAAYGGGLTARRTNARNPAEML